MPIRIKTITQCHLSHGPSGHVSVCGEVDIPIREWGFLPAVMDATYTTGTPAPSNKYINVTFPELSEWNESNYNKYKFKISVSYENSEVDWLGFSSQHLDNNEFTNFNIASARVDLVFQNLAMLSPGIYNASIIFEAYGVSSNNLVFVESRNVPIKLTVLAGENTGIVTNKEEFNLEFNKSTGLLTGEKEIIVFTEHTILVSYLEPPFNITVNEVYEIGKKILKLNMVSTDLNVGSYSQPFTISYYDVFNTQNVINKNVTINLNVIDDNNDFVLSPVSFDFLVQQNPSETKTGTVNITNPNNIDLQVSIFPSFIENVNIINGESLVFTTKPSESLAIGDYNGTIIIESSSVSKSIDVHLKVAKTLDSDFNGDSGFYFALDPNKIHKTKTLPTAVYVKMHLQMYYRGFGNEYTEEQTYEFPYFRNQVEIYPGEEIQDFFIKCKSLDPEINPFFNYALATVNIRITEHDDNDVELSEYYLTNLLFAPGKKPKCFPLFTDYNKRSTRDSSIIRVGFDTIMNKAEIADIFEIYQDDLIVFPAKAEVHSLNFNRNKFNPELENEIISTSGLDLIPFPNLDNPVHIFWENQNLVFDWFTGAVKHSQSVSYEHLFNSDDEDSGKYGTKVKKALMVNTGWILREEIDLIDDMIKSRICFLKIGNNWIKGYPTSKKNELWDSEENLFQMDIEFKINTDER